MNRDVHLSSTPFLWNRCSHACIHVCIGLHYIVVDWWCSKHMQPNCMHDIHSKNYICIHTRSWCCRSYKKLCRVSVRWIPSDLLPRHSFVLCRMLVSSFRTIWSLSWINSSLGKFVLCACLKRGSPNTSLAVKLFHRT